MENLATVGFSVASWPCQVIMIVFTLFFHFWFIPYCFAPVNTYTLQRFFLQPLTLPKSLYRWEIIPCLTQFDDVNV